MVAAEAIMIISQKLSWASGQMYFLLRSRTRMMVSLAMALEGVEEGESWRYGYMGIWEKRALVADWEVLFQLLLF